MVNHEHDETGPWGPKPFRIVIEGEVPDVYLPELLDGIRKITPAMGGFTLTVGTAVDAK